MLVKYCCVGVGVSCSAGKLRVGRICVPSIHPLWGWFQCQQTNHRTHIAHFVFIHTHSIALMFLVPCLLSVLLRAHTQHTGGGKSPAIKSIQAQQLPGSPLPTVRIAAPSWSPRTPSRAPRAEGSCLGQEVEVTPFPPS